MPKNFAIVIMIVAAMREMKKRVHRGLVVIRMSMMVMENLAVASEQGMMQKLIQRSLRAWDACSGCKDLMCFPRP